MTVWEKISYLHHKKEPWGFHEAGNPQYLKNQKIINTYTYNESYTVPGTNLTKSSIELFDNRNHWLKKGLSSRIFPIWSNEKFYKEFHLSLFNTLLKRYWAYQYNTSDSLEQSAEDYFYEAILYFLKKIENEQLLYSKLSSETASFCHYPVDNTYKNGNEILHGILFLYHAKIKNIIQSAAYAEKEIPLIAQDIQKNISYEIDDSVLEMKELYNDFISELMTLKKMDSLKNINYFFEIQLDVKKQNSIVNKSGIPLSVFQKYIYISISKIIPGLLLKHNIMSYDLAFHPQSKKYRKKILQIFSNYWFKNKDEKIK